MYQTTWQASFLLAALLEGSNCVPHGNVPNFKFMWPLTPSLSVLAAMGENHKGQTKQCLEP